MVNSKTVVNVDLFMHNTEITFDHCTAEQEMETEGNWRDRQSCTVLQIIEKKSNFELRLLDVRFCGSV